MDASEYELAITTVRCCAVVNRYGGRIGAVKKDVTRVYEKRFSGLARDAGVAGASMSLT
jgi:hypothetical protein